MGKVRALVPLSLGVAVLLIAGALFISPQLVSADNPGQGAYDAPAKGLVPCNGIDCQACNVVDLLNNIINFLIGLSIPISMALFAYAGVIYFTSGGDMGKVKKAHSIFRRVLIGIIVALTAYVVVENVLHLILSPDYWKSWNQIQCVDDKNRPMNANVGQLLGQAQVLDDVVGQLAQQGISVVPSCPVDKETGQRLYQWVPEKGVCLNPMNGDTKPPDYTTTTGTRGTTVCSNSNTACSPNVLLSEGLTAAEANAMSCIAVTESSGNPSIGCSETSTPCGLYQINNANWDRYAPPGCEDRSLKHDARCSVRTAVAMLRTEGYQPWSGVCYDRQGCGNTSYGQRWNSAAYTCVNTFDPRTGRNR